MNGEERRKVMLDCIRKSNAPLSGSRLAELFGISRQVVVQDIALLRAADCEIISTNRGYLCTSGQRVRRIFEVKHTEKEIAEELYAIVDCGGTVEDIFIRHEVYGELRAEMHLSSRRQVKEFLGEIQNGGSAPLSHITSGHHYHTILAESEDVLDSIEEELKELGYLVKKQLS